MLVKLLPGTEFADGSNGDGPDAANKAFLKDRGSEYSQSECLHGNLSCSCLTVFDVDCFVGFWILFFVCIVLIISLSLWGMEAHDFPTANHSMIDPLVFLHFIKGFFPCLMELGVSFWVFLTTLFCAFVRGQLSTRQADQEDAATAAGTKGVGAQVNMGPSQIIFGKLSGRSIMVPLLPTHC